MSDEQPTRLEQHAKDHRFVIMIFGSIVIALLLVAIALGLYGSSGAYQLDLSRPGDANLRKQVEEDTTFKGFSNQGELDASAIEEFEAIYNEKLGDVTASPSFDPEILNPQAFGIDQKSATRKKD